MFSSRALALRRTLFGVSRRHASGDVWYSSRWVEQTRRESGLTFADDPPTAPLSEDHDIGDAECDFGNWFDKAEDVSTAQAVVGLATALGFCFGIYKIATKQAENKPAHFTLRELPTLEADFPTLKRDD